MKPSRACLDLIRQFEGCKLEAYLDARGTDKRWTVGYGATGFSIGPTTKWTQEQADQDLLNRLTAISDQIIRKVKPSLKQCQFDALCCFVYNIGIGAFTGSTMIRLLNERKFEEAAEQFMRWTKAGGVELKGLIRRREAEKRMFLS